MTQRRRALSAGLSLAMLALTLAAIIAGSPKTLGSLRAQDVAALAISLAMVVLLERIHVPLLPIAYGKRRHVEPPYLTLALPILLTIFTMYGAVAAAALLLCGFALASIPHGGGHFVRRLADAGAAGFFWICLGFAGGLTLVRAPALSLQSYLLSVALYAGAILFFMFFVWSPLKSLAQALSIARLWRNLVRDARPFAYTILAVSWGYVCCMIWHRAGMALGLAGFAPLPIIACALGFVHARRLEAHRLRLARDAVQAMLRTNDPLPQMNSLLASLHTPSAEETLQIYAALAPEDRLSPLATIGPIPPDERLESARNAVARLQETDRPSIAERSNRALITAYAVRGLHEELLGALVVHRTARSASPLWGRRFIHAAQELAPLLRDFRTIAATQTAARIDALTGLPNRRTIMHMLREHVEAAPNGSSCAVLLVDVDHFKSINDTLGHQAGDECLRMVSRVVARNVRSIDRAGRIGGEEFVVIMPEGTSEMACAVGERLRAAIERASLRRAGGEPVTVSIGVAVGDPDDTVDSLLARADEALYAAKRRGRNRVIELGA